MGKSIALAVYSRMSMPRRSDRPTAPPLFDVLQFAKDSDASMRTVRQMAVRQELGASELPILDDGAASAADARSLEPRSETRLATRPTMGATLTDEGWARKRTGAPIVVMPYDQLRRLPLDHRAGFLLSLMDGTIDLATVIEVSAMPEAQALRVVRDLFDTGVIGFR